MQSSNVNSAAIDRSAVSRSLAKAIAYAQCGKQAEAEQWAAELVRQLQCASILRTATMAEDLRVSYRPKLRPSMSCPSSDPSSELEGGAS